MHEQHNENADQRVNRPTAQQAHEQRNDSRHPKTIHTMDGYLS